MPPIISALSYASKVFKTVKKKKKMQLNMALDTK